MADDLYRDLSPPIAAHDVVHSSIDSSDQESASNPPSPPPALKRALKRPKPPPVSEHEDPTHDKLDNTFSNSGLLYDSAHLSSLSPRELHEEMCANAKETMQLWAELRRRYYKMEREKEESDRRARESDRRAEESAKRTNRAKKKVLQLTQKHKAAVKDLEVEVSCGQGFLSSEAGKKAMRDAGQEAVEKFRWSVDFIDECNRKAHELAKGYVAMTIRDSRKFIRHSGRYPTDDFTWMYPEVKDEDEAGMQ